jgi:hypothetical protein
MRITRRQALAAAAAAVVLPLRFHWPDFDQAPESGTASYNGSSGYSITWERSVWKKMDWLIDQYPLPPDETDYLPLVGQGRNHTFLGTAAYFETKRADRGDSVVALVRYTDRFVSEKPRQPVLDDKGLPIAAYTSSRAYSVWTIVLKGIELFQHLECRTLIPGESVVRIAYATPLDGLEDRLPFWNQLLASLTVADPTSRERTASPMSDDTASDQIGKPSLVP